MMDGRFERERERDRGGEREIERDESEGRAGTRIGDGKRFRCIKVNCDESRTADRIRT